MGGEAAAEPTLQPQERLSGPVTVWLLTSLHGAPVWSHV